MPNGDCQSELSLLAASAGPITAFGSPVAAGSSIIEPTIEELSKRIAELVEENAQLADAVAARDAFLAIASHELRNPMTPIVGRVSVLRRMIGNGRMEPDKSSRASIRSSG